MSRRKSVEKFLTLILRHKPEAIGITLDTWGYADVEELISGIQRTRPEFTRSDLAEIVETSDKQRFEFDGSERIRACQGHSIQIDIGLCPTMPETHLYHGTTERAWKQIQASGKLQGMTRQYVQLSQSVTTAYEVGRRHGTDVCILTIYAGSGSSSPQFFRASNGVWLVKEVPIGNILAKKYPNGLDFPPERC
jgi:putative RNA 2'-phosphotransferase